MAGVLSWDDILKCRGAWDTIVWFAALVMMADFLSKLGLVGWLATSVGSAIDHLGVHWSVATLLLILLYVYSHYFSPALLRILRLCSLRFRRRIRPRRAASIAWFNARFLLLLMMSLTHYGTGTAPIIFGSGYVTLAEWWKTGLVMSVVNLTIWGDRRLLVALVGILVVNTAGGAPPALTTSLFSGFCCFNDDGEGVCFQRSTTNQRTVDVRLSKQFCRVSRVYRTAVLDDYLLSDFRVSFSNVVTNKFVNSLSLSRSCRFTGTDSPYWFVSDNDAFECCRA